MTHDDPRRLIGSAAAAAIHGKSIRTIHRLVASGELRPAAIAPGGPHGVYLFRPEDVEALAAKERAS